MRKKFITKALAFAMTAAMATTILPSMPVDAATPSNEVSQREKEHAALSKKAASEGMVLLKNRQSVLPIKPGKVALFGPGAEKPIKGGTGSGDVNQRYVISVTEGLKNAGFSITSQSFLDRWLEAFKKGEEEFGEGDIMSGSYVHPDEQITDEEMKEASKGTDTAIYILSRRSGEGSDRKDKAGDYELSETEEKNLTAIGKEFGKVVVVLNVGGIIDTQFMHEIKGLDSLLVMSNAGMESGNALADVLTGKVTPSGKLTDTWAKDYSDYASAGTFGADDGDTLEEVYEDGIYVGYRYFDSFDIDPEYEFGYGDSYTDFDIKVNSVKADAKKVTTNVTVTNTGKKYSGKEVVQVYFSAPDGSIEKPYQELAGYAKTDNLAPGEKQTLTISYNTTEMSSYDEAKAAYVMEAGKYIVRVGNSSRNTKASAVIRLNKKVTTEQLSNQLVPEEKIDEMTRKGQDCYQSPTEAKDLKEAVKINLNGNKIKKLNNASEYDDESVTTYTTDKDYQAKSKEDLGYEEKVKVVEEKDLKLQDVIDGKGTMEEFVAQMSLEELATLNEGIGFANFFGSAEPIVGAQSDTVDGAAGETVSDYVDSYGIPAIVLADGPAGIRISQNYTSYPTKEDAENKTNGVTMYQYCTAWPIGTLLAQTWDMDLIKEVGKSIGEEMVEMGVTLWLAPGMNIHRNPLCGRNFEYFSEDPFVTGMTAIAETSGVQSNPGIGVTIKHFAANNQEDDRNTTNSVISERALREIYLKGFEMAVKAAEPMAIMSSYNKLNGTYTMNEYDLLEDITRGEWGYDGLVMTDWFDAGSDAVAMHAGNDMIMPGGNANNIIGGVKDVAPDFNEDGQVKVSSSFWGDTEYKDASWNEFKVSADGTKTVEAPITSGKEAAVDADGYITVGGEKLILSPNTDESKQTYVTTDVASVKEDGKAIIYKGEYEDNNILCLGDVQKSALRNLNIISKSYQMAALTTGDGTKAASYTSYFDDLASYSTVEKADVVKSTKISFKKSSVSIVAGKTATQKAIVQNTSKKPVYKSSNTKVATVSTSGKVTAKRYGTATITATVNGKSASYKVSVVPASVKVEKVRSTGSKKIAVTYKTVKGAASYRISLSRSKNFTDKRTVTVKARSGKTNTTTITRLSGGKKYYVKVNAISSAKTVGGHTNVRTVTVKK